MTSARRLLKSEPVLLLHDGRLLDDVTAVILETDGSFSVVPRAKTGDGSALVDVVGLVR